jgi:hypothetical protein
MALSANFVADFSSFIAATREAVSAMQGFKMTAQELGPAADRSLEDTQKQAEQIGRGFRQLGTDVVAFSSTFIKAFTEEQDAVNSLTTSLQATGNATPAVVAAYSAMATQFQATTKYADEAIIAAQSTLTTIGQVGPEQMQLALTAVTNLASGMKMDLSQAALMVAKAFESGGEHLGKLKTLLGEAYHEGMTATEMLDAINQRFGPAAQNELNTYNGQLENMNNQMSDFNEQIGKVLVDMLTKVLGAFRSLPESVQTVTIAVVAIGTAIAPVLVSLSSLISILATTGIGAGMMTALTAIVGVMTGPAGLVVAAVALAAAIYLNWDKIVGYTQRLYEGIKAWLVDKFTAIVSSIRAQVDAIVGIWNAAYNALIGHSIVPDILGGIRDNFSQLDSAMVQPVKAATAESIRAYMELMRYTNQANAVLRENSLYTTRSQLDRINAIPMPGTGGGSSSGPVTVNNTFNISGGTEDIARQVSEAIMRTVRAGTQLGTA